MILDFLWRLRGSVSLKETMSDDEAMERVRWLLTRQRKPLTRQSIDHLIFDDPLWDRSAFSRWRAMFLYDCGRFWIDHSPRGRRLRYDLRSLHAMLFCLIGPIAGVVVIGWAWEDPAAAAGAAALGFAWLYGMNLLIALITVPMAIRDAIRRNSLPKRRS